MMHTHTDTHMCSRFSRVVPNLNDVSYCHISCLNLGFGKYDRCKIDTWVIGDADTIYYAKVT